MKLEIRPLLVEDFKNFVVLSDEFLAESPLFSRVPKKSVLQLVGFFNAVFEFPEEFCAFLGYVDGTLAGMTVAKRVPFIFAESNFVHDIMFFILPKYRGTLLIRKFTKGIEKWAFDDDDCFLVQLTAMASGDNERTSRLATALGYPIAGHFMVKERH